MSILLDALGFVGDTLGRPGAAVRGALAGRPDQLLNLLPGSETMGLMDPSRKVSGRDLNRMYGLAGGDDTWSNFAGGMATELLTDPTTILGGAALARKGLSSLGGGSKGLTMNPGLRQARSKFAMAKEVGEDMMPRAVIGGLDDEAKLGSLVAGQVMKESTPYAGIYFPGKNVGATVAGSGPKTARHEIIHGLVDQVAQGASGEGLPLAVRAAGMLKRGAGDKGLRAGLGELADETVAYGLQERGLMNQLGGAANFLFGNNPLRSQYAAEFAKQSPFVGAAYRNLPNAARMGVGATGLVGGYTGASALSDMIGAGDI